MHGSGPRSVVQSTNGKTMSMREHKTSNGLLTQNKTKQNEHGHESPTPSSPISSKSSSSKSSKGSPNGHHHKHHKKHKKSHSKKKPVHAPILIFPYQWIAKDVKYENNKQFHKKSKPLEPRITAQTAIDHLLSPSKCSKRYLSAYCLNLQQLTTPQKLLQCIIKKATPPIKQLYHLTNENNKLMKANASSMDEATPKIGPVKTHKIESASMPPSPYQLPIQNMQEIVPNQLTPTALHSNSVRLDVINDDLDIIKESNNGQLSVKPNKININENDINDVNANANGNDDYSPITTPADMVPLANNIRNDENASTNNLNTFSQPTRLDLVETRSCPDLYEYNHLSDEISGDQMTPPNHTSILLTNDNSNNSNRSNKSNKSNASSTASTNSQKCSNKIKTPKSPNIEEQSCIKPSNAMIKQDNNSTYKTKMKAYCIATVKHNIDVLYHWIYYYPEDFADTTLLDKLLSYIAKVKDKTPQQKSVSRRWQKLLQLIQHRKPEMKFQSILSSSISNLRIVPKVREHGRKTSFQFTDSFFPPREMVQKLGGGIDLLKIHPALVADQLTLIDTEIFLQIRLREFTNQSWQNRPNLSSSELLLCDEDEINSGLSPKSHKKAIHDKINQTKIDAPNLLYMIDHVNRLSLWVATEILSRNTTAEMADMTKYFYVVANRCLQLCNIHTCTAIFGGICLQPLTRLRRLNRYLADDEQIQNLHRALSEMVSSNSNYKTYRNFIEQWYNQKEIQRPCIPFIPVVMKDLFQIQLKLTTKLETKMDNDADLEYKREKYVDLGLLEKNCRHIRRVYETQQKSKLYANQLPADTDIQSKLRMNIAKFETHDTLRAWSFEIQPKLTKEDKENLEMIDTLEEFGFL